MAKPKKKSPRRSGAKPSSNRQLWWLLALLAALLLMLASVGLLGRLQRWFSPPAPEPPVLQQTTPPTAEALRTTIENHLGLWGVSHAQLTPLAGAIEGYRVAAPFPEQERQALLRRKLQTLAPGLTLVADVKRARLTVIWQEQPIFLLRFVHASTTRKPRPQPATRGRIAIVMDDLGRERVTAQRLLRIDLPITLAILPGEPNAAAVAELAHRQRREVLIHLPMEPEAYPAANPGSDALFVDLTPEELTLRVHRYLRQVPYAVGGNNHMGSRFTAERRGMATVLAALKEAGLFFIDSRTTPHSVALDEAERQGVPALGRDVFLDNVEEVDRIGAEIDKLADLALTHGAAIGICHPHKATLEALRRAVPRLRQRGVTVVPVAQLLAEQSAADGN